MRNIVNLNRRGDRRSFVYEVLDHIRKDGIIESVTTAPLSSKSTGVTIGFSRNVTRDITIEGDIRIYQDLMASLLLINRNPDAHPLWAIDLGKFVWNPRVLDERAIVDIPTWTKCLDLAKALRSEWSVEYYWDKTQKLLKGLS